MTRASFALSLIPLLAGVVAAEGSPPYYQYEIHPLTGELVAGGSSRAALNRSVVASPRQGGPARVLFTAPTGEIYGYELARTNGLLAVATRVWSAKRPQVTERVTLHVVDVKGNTITTVDQGRRYSWRRDGSAIAVVTGEYRGANEDFASTGVLVLDVGSKTVRKISDRGNYVVWAAFDDNIYIWDTGIPGTLHPVHRYNLAIGQLEETSHLGIELSPSGKYYFKPDGVAGRPGIYTTDVDDSVLLKSRALAAYQHVNPVSWAPDRDVLMLIVQKASTAAGFVRAMYDPTADSVTELDVDKSSVVGWGATSSEVLVFQGGESISVRAVADLRRR